MSKERLEEIKNELKWLIKQVERVEELEQQNKRYREVIEYVMTAKSTHYSSLENALEDIKYVINEVLERDSE